ncbi:hypothetical protein [Maribacter algarum]|uniref:hypothetical protein n=1 Tax=Maribacter algarum (ex Zhang et al. 2020) TaxID=2578118 RepID=UPI001485D023|nr:hypothetical protein [Maribacter algarum]
MVCILIESKIQTMVSGFLKSRPMLNLGLRKEDLALVVSLAVLVDEKQGLVYY